MSTVSLDNRRFLSVTEAAEVIGCTTGRVRQLLIAGDLPGEKINARAWALRRAVVERFAKTTAKTGRPRQSPKV